MQLTNLGLAYAKVYLYHFSGHLVHICGRKLKKQPNTIPFLPRKSVYGPEVPANSLKIKNATNKSCWAYAKVYLYQFSSCLVHICGHKLKKQPNTTTYLPQKFVFGAKSTCKQPHN